jgi:glycosyltransferase involved in cell wall biosynthesis
MRPLVEGAPDGPRSVSVVVASGAGDDFLPRCLESLRGQVDPAYAEVLVVDRCGGETAARIRRQHPFVTLIEPELDHRPSVPELRAIGAERARGDIVAILEEHCVAQPNWIATIRTSFQPDDAAIGGPILPQDYDRLRDWVVYLSEYHSFLPPWPEGERIALNGANIAYDREKLLRHRDILRTGYWEVVLHSALSREGRFRAVPTMGVTHTGPFDYRYYLGQRYLLSRVWGGTQRDHVGRSRRLLYLGAAPLFPGLLLARIGRRVAQSEVSLSRYLAAWPLLVPVTVAYVWGEWLGYLVGAGDALEKVE